MARGVRGTGLLQLHDRWDMVIPPNGRLSAQGWYYETVLATLAGWASPRRHCHFD